MEPLYFGPEERQLYGVYHASERYRQTNTGVVLCYPAGQEYMRIHRAYRWLADKLANQGFHVLRFDYSGQGNSGGQPDANTLDRWIDDAEHAAQEIRSISGAQRLCMIGLRVGTIVATQVAKRLNAAQLVLWEPRLGAESFTAEMRAQLDQSDDPLSDFVAEDGTLNLNGFSYSSAFMDSVESNSCADLTELSSAQVLLVTANESTACSEFSRELEAAGTQATNLVIPGPDDWNTVDDGGWDLLAHAHARRHLSLVRGGKLSMRTYHQIRFHPFDRCYAGKR